MIEAVIFAIKPVKGADRIITHYDRATAILNSWGTLTYAILDPKEVISLAQNIKRCW